MDVGPEDLLVKRLSGSMEAGFDALYDIYSHTIASSEQKPRHALEAMTQNKNYRLFIASSEERIVGFSILYLSDARDFALLEYMAVRESAQGHGIGSRLFRDSIDALQQSDGPCPVLLEIDSDREITPDRATRLRRIRFYKNLGCRRIHGLAYIMPGVGSGAPPQMDLYVFQEKAENVTKSDLRRWLATIYREVYKRPEHDPRIHVMLNPLDELIVFEKASGPGYS